MSVAPHQPGAMAPREPDDLYATPPPWGIGRSQPAFLSLTRSGAILGRVLDAGCGTGEHTLMAGEDRTAYTGGLRSVLRPGGRCFMLCISDRERCVWGPVHKVRRGDVEAAFADGWQIDSVEPSAIELSVAPGHVDAWFVAVTRI